MPLHKSASKADIKNYHGIISLPRISLVVEKIYYNFIYEKIRHKLSDCHNGFRSRRSIFTLLLDYVDTLYNLNDNNENFKSVYFDLKKHSTVFLTTNYFLNYKNLASTRSLYTLIVHISLIASNLYVLAMSFIRRALFLVEFHKRVRFYFQYS